MRLNFKQSFVRNGMPIVMEVILPRMLLAINLNFLLFFIYLDDMMGQLFALFVLTVAAVESAIGLALLVILFRIHRTIAVEFSVGDTEHFKKMSSFYMQSKALELGLMCK